MEEQEKRLGLLSLIALTVSSVIGGGVFNLMTDMANVASVGATTIALVLSGVGMGVYVVCLQILNQKLPQLDAGIYSYTDHAFGSFVGFNSALGYWLSVFLANVALASLVFSALSYFFNLFGDGQNIYSVIGASLLLWGMHFIFLRGANFASKINGIVTIAKLIPLFIFIISAIIAFDADLFSAETWGTINNEFSWSQVAPQIKSATMLSVWVFVGVEGAVVYSARAKNKKIVGKATALSFVLIISIYLLATVLSFAVLSREELAGLAKPGMAQVLESIVGPWGAILINLGVIISALGAWFACTMFAGEILYQGAKDNVFPHVFAIENKHEAPKYALILTNGLVQFFLLSLLVNKSAYNFMAILSSSTMLVPYLFVSLSLLKLAWDWKKGFSKEFVLALISSIYMAYCIFATGATYFLLTSLLFAPGMLLYLWSKKHAGEKPFNKAELVGAIALVACAIISIYLIATGKINVSLV